MTMTIRTPIPPATALLGIWVLAILLLGGCRTSRITPYAWMPTEDDPRLFIRVPEGTPGSTPVPKEERLHRNAWAREVGEIETPDPRAACCDEGEPFPRNELGLILGYTELRGGGGATLGLVYERRLRRGFGVGVFGEYVFGEKQVPVCGALFVLHPTERLTLSVGVGAEFDDGEAERLVRLGGMYRLYERGGFAIAPAIHVDFLETRDPVAILAVEISRGF
jgi:hypothetical protein